MTRPEQDAEALGAYAAEAESAEPVEGYAEAGPGAEAGPEAEAGVETEAGPGTEADAEAETDAGTEAAASAADELAAARAERDGYLGDLQRTTAEFANFRRQTARRNADVVAQAAARLAESLLPVLDACEAGASQGAEGVGAVQSQLLGVLAGQGLAVIGETGEPFDPNHHEAVTVEAPAEGDDAGEEAGPVVAAVLRTGYAWNGRVLRPAMVKVLG